MADRDIQISLRDCAFRLHDIPVTVKEGPKTIGTAKSLRWLELHGSPGVLEARLEYAVIGRQEITLQIRLKDYNTKRP